MDGSRTVHREDCPFLPEQKKRIFLGFFQSSYDALEEGRKYFNIPGNCIYCSKEHYTGEKMKVLSELINDQQFVSVEHLKFDYDEPLYCSIN